jgi:hypothetical protein
MAAHKLSNLEEIGCTNWKVYFLERQTALEQSESKLYSHRRLGKQDHEIECVINLCILSTLEGNDPNCGNERLGTTVASTTGSLPKFCPIWYNSATLEYKVATTSLAVQTLSLRYSEVNL